MPSAGCRARRLWSPWGRRPDLFENPALEGKPYQEHVIIAAKSTQVDPALIHAVITAESNYNPNAVSDKGAVGTLGNLFRKQQLVLRKFPSQYRKHMLPWFLRY